jgi:hypothetical protein
MAKKDNLLKSKAMYTVRRQHSVAPNGVIYENDHVTITPHDEFSNEVTLFAGSNFKYCVNSSYNPNRRHNRSEFISPEGSDEEVWTLETISDNTSVSEESKIVLKPNYTSLKDFAYYGSATELIRATVNGVIQNFPGGLYYYGPTAPELFIDNKKYYLISNEFNIDCWTGGGAIISANTKNPMRLLAASYMNYTIGNTDAECTPPIYTKLSECPGTIIGQVEFGAGEFLVYMNASGEKYLVKEAEYTVDDEGNVIYSALPNYDVIIKPKQSFIDEYWENIDDFTQVLLNRNTTPIYKATFETPYFTESGYFYQNKQYIWPTVGDNGTTPDITTGAFQGYLESLISLATFHDTYDSDNIWRMMTHESIKNLDWTLTNKKGDIEDDLSDFDTTGIGAMLRIYGRQFDDIKRYADNIKRSNNISYDEKGNTPDYFLTDKIEDNGWVPQHTAPFIGTKTDDVVIEGTNSTLYKEGCTIANVNSAFQRRLALSSKYIQSLKGTRRGLEAILGMFGYKCVNDSDGSNATTIMGEYNIYEYVATVDANTDDGITHLSYDEGWALRGSFDNLFEMDGVIHMLEGCPVAVVTTKVNNEEIQYLIPWFDDDVRTRTNYFQSKGGWGKRQTKRINIAPLSASTVITSDEIFTIYGETQPYMTFVDNLEELCSQNANGVYSDIICYVTDITNIKKAYKPYSPTPEEFVAKFDKDEKGFIVFTNNTDVLRVTSAGTAEYTGSNATGSYVVSDDILTFKTQSGTEIKMQLDKTNYTFTIIDNDDYSHYFILKNVSLSFRCGYLSNSLYDCYGWKNIRSCEMMDGNITVDGKRVLYLESIGANYMGNNPHVGYGKYDDGREYLEQFEQIFRTEINDGLLDELKISEPDIYNSAVTFGFNIISAVCDNNKCAFFKDYEYENDDLVPYGKADEIEEWNSKYYRENIKFIDTPDGITECADETQANGIINTKKIVINFGIGNNEHMKNYIENVVLRYLEEMIPSTAIVEYRFDNI